MKRLFFPLLISILFTCRFSAAKNTDSLEAALSIAKEDTARVNLLNVLASEYRTIDNKKSLDYGNQALSLAEKIDYKKGMATAYNNIGITYGDNSDYEKEKTNYFKALELWRQIGHKSGIAKTLNNIGFVYYYMGNYEKAIQYALQSLKIQEELNDAFGIATALVSIGNIYNEQGNYNKSLEANMKALEQYQKIKNKNGIALVYNNIGNTYNYQDMGEKAIEYYSKCIEAFEEIGKENMLAVPLNNIGTIYFDQKNYDKAISFYQRSFEIKKMLNDKEGIASAYNNFGNVYKEKGDFQKALEYQFKCISVGKEIGAKPQIVVAYRSIAETYAASYDLVNAYKYHRMYSDLKDTLFNSENSKQIAEMQTKYETEKKEQQLIAQDAELKKNLAEIKQKTIQRNAILFGGVISLILMIVVYKGYREKKKANIAITLQKEVIEQKNKNITDSINYAKRIQTAILPSKEFIIKLFPESFVFYQPRDIVSGDFYFFAEVGNKKIAAACDCTGHGVPGAFMSMIGNDFLHRIVNELQITDTAQIMNELHKNIILAMNQEKNNRTSYDGMDAAVLCYDSTKKEVQYSGAVRPLYYFDSSGFNEIKGERYSIGGIAASTFEFSSQKISVSNGASFYLFSDGYADQFGGSAGKKFMAKRFKELLISFQGKKTEEQEKSLDEELRVWKKEREQVDDVLVIGIKI